MSVTLPFKLDPDSDDAIREQTYLIERGVRPVATFGTVPIELAESVYARLASCSPSPRVIPFVIDRGGGRAICGLARNRWCVDIIRWIHTDKVAPEYRAMVLGLLLGYSSESIEEYVSRSQSGVPVDLNGS